MSSSPEGSPPAAGGRGRRLLLLVSGTLLLTFVLAEVALRLMGATDFRRLPGPLPARAEAEKITRRSQVPGLIYELQPGVAKRFRGSDVVINSHGLRGPEPTPMDAAAPPLRAVALGDSYTFGFGVGEDEPWPRVIERLLNARVAGGRRWEVLNFGVGGYSTRDEAAVLEHRARCWKPDLILLGYALNDPDYFPEDNLRYHYADPEWWQYSHVLRFAAEVRYRWALAGLGGGDYIKYVHAEPDLWASVEQGFADIRRIGDELGAPVVMLIFPVIHAGEWGLYLYHAIHEQVAGAAEQAGLVVIDLRDDWFEHAPYDLRVSEQDNHPNGAGHELAARRLLQVLEAVPGLLPEG